jgi:uncharacterized membrane protein
MSEFLSKEEIKQWRGSLEKITLEEYAARLGKTIEEEKRTHDIIDIVLKGQPVMSKLDNLAQTRGEKLTSIAQRAFEREKQISKPALTIPTTEKKAQPAKKPAVKTEKAVIKEQIEAPVKQVAVAVAPNVSTLKEEVRLVFNKALTDREQAVFDYFAQNKNKIVYAKDLAKLLDLPRDYVYKYIKNLRSKIDGDRLQNADNGGYLLNV